MNSREIAVIAGLLGIALFKSTFALQTCPPAAPTHADWVWRASDDIAAKLPPSSSAAYGQGAEGGAVIWNVPGGRLDARWGIAPISWWTHKAEALCETRIDGFSATIYQITTDTDEQLAAVLPRSALGKDLVITVTLRDGKHLAAELAMLTNIVFINDPARLRVVSIGQGATPPSAVIVDEIGRERRLKLGDFISERAGALWEIDGNSVVTKSASEVGENSSLTLHRLPLSNEDERLSRPNR